VLERLFLTGFFRPSLMFAVKARSLPQSGYGINCEH